jgi:hypothetical protein
VIVGFSLQCFKCFLFFIYLRFVFSPIKLLNLSCNVAYRLLELKMGNLEWPMNWDCVGFAHGVEFAFFFTFVERNLGCSCKESLTHPFYLIIA